SGAHTAVMAVAHSSDRPTCPATVCPAGRAPGPRIRARTAFAVTVTGWWVANGCSHDGMVWVGTNTALVKPSGNTTMYTAAWTASAVRTSNPTTAITHDQAYPNANAIPMPPSMPSRSVCHRNPMANPTVAINARVSAERHRSDSVRPARTATRAIGS